QSFSRDGYHTLQYKRGVLAHSGGMGANNINNDSPGRIRHLVHSVQKLFTNPSISRSNNDVKYTASSACVPVSGSSNNSGGGIVGGSGSLLPLGLVDGPLVKKGAWSSSLTVSRAREVYTNNSSHNQLRASAGPVYYSQNPTATSSLFSPTSPLLPLLHSPNSPPPNPLPPSSFTSSCRREWRCSEVRLCVVCQILTLASGLEPLKESTRSLSGRTM
ncbi:hypothetical protein JOQ06_001106, partial [Pogonophryne albipinna]